MVADEVWTIESQWSPTGLQAFVTFLVDPFPYSENRRQGDNVWAVKCTSTWPEVSEPEHEIVELPLKQWDVNVIELADTLSAFRNNVP